MSRLATTGTFSCCAISVSGFKGEHTLAEKRYMEDSGDIEWREFKYPSRGIYTVGGFYDNILFPTEQELGETKEYAFSDLMEQIEQTSMKSKVILAVLNANQMAQDSEFWPKRLKHWGFRPMHRTYNSIGELCTMWVRSYNEVDVNGNFKNEKNSKGRPVGSKYSGW